MITEKLEEAWNIFIKGNHDDPVARENFVLRAGHMGFELMEEGNRDRVGRPLNFSDEFSGGRAIRGNFDFENTPRLIGEFNEFDVRFF